jgi:hypothetical protein
MAWIRKLTWWQIVALVAAGVSLCGLLSQVLRLSPLDFGNGKAGSDQPTSVPGTASTPAATRSPRADATEPYRAFLRSHYEREPSWTAHVKRVAWTQQGAAEAHTDLPSNWVDTSRTVEVICLTLAAYVTNASGEPWHGVAVLAVDGRPLARRNAPTDPCTATSGRG